MLRGGGGSEPSEGERKLPENGVIWSPVGEIQDAPAEDCDFKRRVYGRLISTGGTLARLASYQIAAREKATIDTAIANAAAQVPDVPGTCAWSTKGGKKSTDSKPAGQDGAKNLFSD